MNKNQTENEDVNRLVPFEDVDLCLEDPAFIHDVFPVDGGPGHLMMFLAAVRSGLYPPIATIDWIFVAFQKFVDSDGERDIKDLLGLNSGPGVSSFFKNKSNQIVKKKIADDVDALIYLGLSTSKACKAVAEKCSTGGYSKFGDGIDLTERTIKNYHSSEYELKICVATKEKPFTFCFSIISEKVTTSMLVASNDPNGADIREKAVSFSEDSSITFSVDNLMERGTKVLKSFPKDTQMWVECEIK